MNEDSQLANIEAAPIVRPGDAFMPVMSIDEIMRRHAALVEFRARVLTPNEDYGAIPGTGGKPTLLKPGAEKLTTYFGLTPRPVIVERVEDWTGENHGGEPFFYYLYRCQLWRGEQLVAEADGSCNSWETKYRYRQGERLCPACGKAAIIKGKAEFGGGWLCFGKKGGCGAKFRDGDTAIEGQNIGRVAHSDPAELANTICKMAQKRAFIAATLLAVNASEFFTQDLEDLDHSEDYRQEPPQRATRPASAPQNGTARPQPPPRQQRADGAELPAMTFEQKARIEEIAPQLYGAKWMQILVDYNNHLAFALWGQERARIALDAMEKQVVARQELQVGPPVEDEYGELEGELVEAPA